METNEAITNPYSKKFPLGVNIHKWNCSEAMINVEIYQYKNRMRKNVDEKINTGLFCSNDPTTNGSIHTLNE